MIASCVRIAYVRAMQNSPDVLYTQGSAAVWSAVEINIGILCNCLAMLKPFVRRHMPWMKSLVGARDSSGKSGGRNIPYAPRSGGGAGPYGKGDHLRRDRRASGGTYELFSYGRDEGFVDGVRKGSACIEAGHPSESDISAQEEAARQRGILVTTTVAMGRSSEGDLSTNDILAKGETPSAA